LDGVNIAPSILISGNDALAASVERDLRTRGVATRRLERRPFELEATDLEGASALVLAADDDGLNVSLALRARRLVPELHVVVRVFDAALVNYLTEALPGVRILSMSSVTAPAFAHAARSALDSPANEARVLAKGAPPLRRRQSRVDYTLVWALAALFLLVFPSAAFFSHVLGIRYMDALYFVWTTVMTVGYGDIALKDASDGAKLFGMFLMLSGATFIAVLFALLSDWVLSRRLETLQGRTPERGSGHVIIAGAGNIGVRVAQLLRASGRRLVIVEHHAESRNARALAAEGHHVIIADATAEETLALAALPRAALVLALTDSDAVNVQVALHARRCGVPVVMRADSAELAAHMVERGDAIALSPVTAATGAFAQAAMQAAAVNPPETLPR
jgi:voltage-gated potassium channel Kch